ncbi:hypothetical protein BFR04_02060 [Gaetbulibacter sp. 4G1]|nr:hypothetical protein [Gaetbulibacter sp. 4G1]PIA79653.1 hypothetical protein BFR04_02060 [Gaetbulibacter sp. 4G1]
MIKKDIFIGFFVGLVANCIGLITAIFIISKKNNSDFTSVMNAAVSEGYLGKLISLGAILNLVAFFIFIKKKQDYRARGVLLITVFIAIFTFVFKLF